MPLIRERPSNFYASHVNNLSLFVWKLMSTIRPWVILYYMSFTRFWNPNMNFVMSAYFWYEYLRLVYAFGGF